MSGKKKKSNKKVNNKIEEFTEEDSYNYAKNNKLDFLIENQKLIIGLENINPSIYKSLESYTLIDYIDINKACRDRYTDNRQIKVDIDNIDSIFDLMIPVIRPMSVYRCFQSGFDVSKSKINNELHFNQYLSTTIFKSFAKWWCRENKKNNMVIKINIPIGLKVLPVLFQSYKIDKKTGKTILKPNIKSEGEILFPRNAVFIEVENDDPLVDKTIDYVGTDTKTFIKIK
jgi:hypothetical protein